MNSETMPLSSSLADASSALRRALTESLSAIPADAVIWVAFSGGLDSTLLLTLAATDPALQPRLRALHINHQLSPNAGDWQAHCEAVCSALEVPLTVNRVRIRKKKLGVEAAAREERYRVFRDTIASDDVLLTGHHADDQAETLLLRLMRGSGLAGLGAMLPVRPLSSEAGETRRVLRPWLAVPRTVLETVAEGMGLAWIHDESNDDQSYERNWMRHEILPRLTGRHPALVATLGRTAERLQADYQLLTELLKPQLESMLCEEQWPLTGRWSLDLGALRQAPDNVRVHALRYWLQRNKLVWPEGEKVGHWFEQSLSAGRDRHPRCDLGQVVLQRFRDKLYVWYPHKPSPQALLQCQQGWAGAQLDVLPTVMNILAGAQVVAAGELTSVVTGKVALRSRPGQPSRDLKDIWQHHGVPVWLRRSWPVVVFEGRPVAVCGLMNDYFLNCELVHVSALNWHD
ncbi:tRNA lysidine(34) synthetase TilS [uncultured Thalassolituus sp.]|uniref:tRNA lysidine(34) synthetase TilS n=2 Tax=uncultured Thalassolituus sp. TaxID=285273 RepID=UPI00261CCFB9|nr:tRNA lysidine(34) synthetase TilS [uncultured Thalassolituus sp.]